MELLPNSDIITEKLDHHGIVAGLMKELRLKEQVDEALGENAWVTKKLTVGDCVCAMVLNGLGFTNHALYLVSSFLKGKPVDRLLREGVTAEDFNDDSLGRALDLIAEHDPTQLFAVVAFHTAVEKNLVNRVARMDSTSFSLHGEYKGFDSEDPDSPQLITVNHGHSKQHRPDLKQVALNLVNSGEAGLPIWAEALSGNSSDKTSFHKTVAQLREFQKRMVREVPEFLWVADSAFYSQKYLLNAKYPFKWITRVPESIRAAKELVKRPDSELRWNPCKNGYKVSLHLIGHGNVLQRWFLFYSKEAYQREIKTFEKKMDKELAGLTKECWHLGNTSFACLADAKKRLSEIMATHPRFLAECTHECKPRFEKKGRPGKNNPQIGTQVFIKVSLSKNHELVEAEKRRKGRFILATNELDEKAFTAEEALVEYKGLNKVERGFRFLKDPQFFVDKLYLKTPNRIAALMAVMSFTLMVYNFGEYWLRKRLSECKETLPNQLKKEIDRPTLRWVFYMMDGVTMITMPTAGSHRKFVANLDALRAKIAGIFGGAVAECYGLQSGFV